MNPSSPEFDAENLDLAPLRARMAAIRALLRDPAAAVDAAALIAELQRSLVPLRGRADARAELREILILMGMAECRCSELGRARDLLAEGLAMEQGAGADPGDLTRDHYFLASVATNLKNFPLAALHYGKAAEHAANAADFALDQRLGIRERQAYALHEAKRYEEALSVNQALLDEGERLLGRDDHRLGTVLVNAAQNLYALRRIPEAAPYLERALAMAEALNDVEREQDLLYQLAVLASEQGMASKARAYLALRVTRLEKGAPGKQLEAARRALAHFDRNQARA